MMETHQFKVEMTCSGCSNAVTRILTKKLEEGATFDVNLDEKLVSIKSEKSKEQLAEMLEKSGKAVEYIGVK